LSYIFSRPVERLIAALSATGSDDRFKLLDTSENRFVPTEYHEMQDTFNAMIRRLDNNHQSMVKMAFSDPVTTLPNRESFRKTLETTLASLALKSVRGTMAFIDIDNFKEINDTHGHHVGDQVLRCLGSRISGIIETASGHFPGSIYSTANDLTGDGLPKPILARFGGDEFVMFLAENSEISHSDEIFEQILLAISSPIPGLETSIELSGSIGLACFPEQGLTYSDLVKRADIAMYHAKKMGKGMIQKFGDGTGEQSQAEIRRDVHLAIINDELELFYQPKINTSDYEVHGVEALIRWIHPVRGLISPGEFIPAIENSDTTNELGEWVIRRACRDMKTFDARGFDLNIAVNIAARQFVSADFAKRIGEIIHEEGCTPERFEIEVTEETALATHQGAADIISKLHEMGFRVSLDDYGRGYSNLTRLSELRVNTLKIDGPLTARITRDKRTRVIFEATINMANGLECKTVAEGVESAEEAAILTRLGCTELQGYYFSTPLPASNMITWLEDRRRSPASALQEKLVANYS
jgi:predicted signal transduction protein with EAL and GGDEF domain